MARIKLGEGAGGEALIVLEERVRARGGKIRLSNLRPEVRDLFSYTNLDSMFEPEIRRVGRIHGAFHREVNESMPLSVE